MCEQCPGCGVGLREDHLAVEDCGYHAMVSAATGLGHCPISCQLAIRDGELRQARDDLAYERDMADRVTTGLRRELVMGDRAKQELFQAALDALARQASVFHIDLPRGHSHA